MLGYAFVQSRYFLADMFKVFKDSSTVDTLEDTKFNLCDNVNRVVHLIPSDRQDSSISASENKFASYNITVLTRTVNTIGFLLKEGENKQRRAFQK